MSEEYDIQIDEFTDEEIDDYEDLTEIRQDLQFNIYNELGMSKWYFY